MSNAFMETFTGRHVPISRHIGPDDIDFLDVWTSLARMPRFLGHTRRPYTVLEHSLLVGEILVSRHCSPEIILAGLLHDAKEAYIGDIPTPIKKAMGPKVAVVLDAMERWIDQAICDKVGIDISLIHCDEVKQADIDALWLEAQYLVKSGGKDWRFSREPIYPNVEWDGSVEPTFLELKRLATQTMSSLCLKLEKTAL